MAMNHSKDIPNQWTNLFQLPAFKKARKGILVNALYAV